MINEKDFGRMINSDEPIIMGAGNLPGLQQPDIHGFEVYTVYTYTYNNRRAGLFRHRSATTSPTKEATPVALSPDAPTAKQPCASVTIAGYLSSDTVPGAQRTGAHGLEFPFAREGMMQQAASIASQLANTPIDWLDLCHGTVGISLMLLELLRHTGDSAYPASTQSLATSLACRGQEKSAQGKRRQVSQEK